MHGQPFLIPLTKHVQRHFKSTKSHSPKVRVPTSEICWYLINCIRKYYCSIPSIGYQSVMQAVALVCEIRGDTVLNNVTSAEQLTLYGTKWLIAFGIVKLSECQVRCVVIEAVLFHWFTQHHNLMCFSIFVNFQNAFASSIVNWHKHIHILVNTDVHTLYP